MAGHTPSYYEVGNFTLVAAVGVPQSADAEQPVKSNPVSKPRLSRAMISKALFALSLFPYLGFLWFLLQANAAFGADWVLLHSGFVAVTIPAGICSSALWSVSGNVDWLHGSAEFFLTLSNILIVLGFRQAVK